MPTALLITDSFEGTRAVRDILTDTGYVVIPAGNSEEAFDHCKHSKIDAVILDILFATAALGTDVLHRIRESCPGIPVLFLSGTRLERWTVADFSNLQKLLPGRVEVLLKPFTAAELRAAMASLLSESYSDETIRQVVASAAMMRQRIAEEAFRHLRLLDG